MTVLVYSPYNTNRLAYTLNLVFNTILGIDYRIIHEIPANSHEPVISYGNIAPANSYSIPESGLLYASEIQEINVKVRGNGADTVLFPELNHSHPFDIFSAVFYLVTRYEEYLPYEQDLYGRFPHTKSIAFNRDFLHLPLINLWVKQLGENLCKQFPSLKINPPPFSFQPTYDIDIAWAYKHKGFFRNAGGFLKKPELSRLLTLCGLKRDPFDIYDNLLHLHHRANLHPVYFWLVAETNSRYDKHILPEKQALKNLIQKYQNQQNGLHPSWQTHDNPTLVLSEKDTLEKILNRRINFSRQHYLRFSLPETYSGLIEAGITHDYSMMYGTINGFRASISNAHSWFNLKTNEVTSLIIHPPCFMDANSYYEQNQSPQESMEELNRYLEVCRKNHGTLITIFHNNFLGTSPAFRGWRELYEAFIHSIHHAASPSSFSN